jgi:hypothetical protein
MPIIARIITQTSTEDSDQADSPGISCIGSSTSDASLHVFALQFLKAFLVSTFHAGFRHHAAAKECTGLPKTIAGSTKFGDGSRLPRIPILTGRGISGRLWI